MPICYWCGPFHRVVPTELPNGEYHAAVYRGDVCIGTCLGKNRLDLQDRAIELAQEDYKAMVQ
ncbi:MAG: hypothetical protein Q7J84_04015 [Sulfuricaulis sp.]|nr:hypothetical protein [Sulfuricaulis sp.]